MGRMFPMDDDPIINPALPFSLMVAGMAATLAIITGLCGFGRKPASDLENSAETAAATSLDQNDQDKTDKNADDSEEGRKELPPPPAMRALRETYSCNNFMHNSGSSRNLKLAMSVKHKRSISMSKIKEFRDKAGREVKELRDKAGKEVRDLKEKAGISKPVEDSIWTKRIILGERCKILDDREEDDDIVFDADGRRITAYHPRTQSSKSLSRSCSLKQTPDTSHHNQDKDKDNDKGTTSTSTSTSTTKKQDDS